MFLLHSLWWEHDYRIGNHPYEDLAKFGYKREMKISNFKCPSLCFWLPSQTKIHKSNNTYFKILKFWIIEKPQSRFIFAFEISLFDEMSPVRKRLVLSVAT
jgi:hypothetical protein